jgi:hypothetical protein
MKQLGADSTTLCLDMSIAELIKLDLLVGIVCAQTAIRAADPDEVSRNRLNARLAHDAALRNLFEAELSTTDSPEIESGFWELRANLEHLGERL